jgi:hypothetical protein
MSSSMHHNLQATRCRCVQAPTWRPSECAPPGRRGEPRWQRTRSGHLSWKTRWRPWTMLQFTGRVAPSVGPLRLASAVVHPNRCAVLLVSHLRPTSPKGKHMFCWILQCSGGRSNKQQAFDACDAIRQSFGLHVDIESVVQIVCVPAES